MIRSRILPSVSSMQSGVYDGSYCGFFPLGKSTNLYSFHVAGNMPLTRKSPGTLLIATSVQYLGIHLGQGPWDFLLWCKLRLVVHLYSAESSPHSMILQGCLENSNDTIFFRSAGQVGEGIGWLFSCIITTWHVLLLWSLLISSINCLCWLCLISGEFSYTLLVDLHHPFSSTLSWPSFSRALFSESSDLVVPPVYLWEQVCAAISKHTCVAGTCDPLYEVIGLIRGIIFCNCTIIQGHWKGVEIEGNRLPNDFIGFLALSHSLATRISPILSHSGWSLAV